LQDGWTYEPPTFFETNSADGPEAATRVDGITVASPAGVEKLERLGIHLRTDGPLGDDRLPAPQQSRLPRVPVR
jgi:hypothetical protein